MSLPFYLAAPGPHWYDGRIPRIALDFETTNREKGDARNPANRLVRVCVDGRILPDTALDSVFRKPCVLIAHHAKFELSWLLRYGVDLSNILPFDTMLAEYVIAGNRGFPLSLDATMQRYGIGSKEAVIDAMMRAGVCPSEMPEHWLDARVRSDTLAARKLFELQYPILQNSGLFPVFFTRCITTPVLACMEAEGLHLHAERTRTAYSEALRERNRLRAELDLATGGINLRSTKQKAEFLYDTLKFAELKDREGAPKRTPSGGRMTGAETLAALKATTPEQKTFVSLYSSFAKQDAALSKTLEFFKGVVDDHDGVFYGNYNQAVTQTHRLSSAGRRVETVFGARGVQFQNMPRVFKPLICAEDEGRIIVEADFAQLEFRVAGQLGHDPQVADDVRNKADVHAFTASVLNRCALPDVKPPQRQEAKKSTFKPLYGGSQGTKREMEYFAEFRKKYAGIDATQREWLRTVLRTKQLTIPSGLTFYWPDTRMTHTGYVTNTPSIFNYPVQSFATADIVPIALVYLFWRTRGVARLVNTIHDSVVATLDAGVFTEYAGLVEQAFARDTVAYLRRVYSYDFMIPLGGEVRGGKFWGDKALAHDF